MTKQIDTAPYEMGKEQVQGVTRKQRDEPVFEQGAIN